MAKLNASKFTNRDILVTGVDPSTGEYLSAAQRKALFRKKKISSNQVFRKPGALVKVGSSAITPDVDVNVLSVRVIAVEKQVSFLAKVLDKEAELERKGQKEREKELLQQEEKQLRSGKEKQLEKGLSKTLLAPVKGVGKAAKSILGNLMELFGVLFAGWLTDKGWKAIAANAQGDIGTLEEIKNRVIKNLAVVTGIFATLNGGLFTILGIIGTITGAIIIAPFKLLGKAFNALRGGGKPTPTPTPISKPSGGKPSGGKPSGGKPSGGKPSGGKPSVSPKPTKPLSPFDLEQARKKVTQERMLSNNKKPGLFKRTASKLKKLFPNDKAVNFAADVATKPKSLFGKIFGALGSLGKKILPLLRAAFFVGAVRDRAIQGMTPAQSILGAMFPLAGSIVGGGLGAGIGAVGGPLSFLGAFAGSWLGDYLGIQVQRFLDFVWKPSWDGAPGIKNFNDTIYSLQSEGVLGSALQGVFPYSSQNTKPGESVESSSASLTSSSSSAASASSAPSIASPSSPQMQVPGPVSSSGNTTVIYKKVGSGGGGQSQQQSMKSGSATDVPLISSSNPDNFYTMYSQLIYNVVN